MLSLRLFGGFLVAAVLLAAAASAQVSNLLVNGSFENGYTGWTATGEQRVANNDPGHPGSNGAAAVVLDRQSIAGAAVLSQTFATTPGQRYGIVFDAGHVGGVIDGLLQVTVQGAGAPIFSRVLAITGIDANPLYTPEHYSFTADAASTTLTFRDQTISPQLVASLLDNVEVIAESADAPLVTAQPDRAAIMQGRNATFIVAATGPGPLTYQWQKNSVNISGATSATLTLPAVTSADAANYRALVSNAAGTTSSSAATLLVLPAGILLNGGFEFGSAAWTLNDTARAYTTLDPSYQPTEGRQVATFNGGQSASGGSMSQTFPTVSGTQYLVSFDLGANSGLNRNQQQARVTVTGQGATLLSQDLSVSAIGGGTAWSAQAWPFVANSDSATLTFTDISTTTVDIDLVLDNVRVTALALPANTSPPANGTGSTIDVGTTPPVAPATTGPFANGSFESDLSGWTATGNYGVVSGSGWTATDGAKAVVFDAGQSAPNGVLSQTFATIAGQSYTLAFDVGATSGMNHDTMTIQATVQGQSATPLLQETASVAAPGNGTTYVARAFTFRADGPSVTLTFADRSATTQNVDLMLDNVRVTASQASGASGGPLRVSAANSRYFVDGSGNPVYLTGSHTWNDLQDISSLGTFDFNAYLNFLAADHQNFTRLWQLDMLGVNLLNQPPLSPIASIPFARTGPGAAADGGLKLDLTQLDQAYFDRLAQRVAAAQSKGIYVAIMLFDGFWVSGNPGLYWPSVYFNPANIVNNIPVAPDQVYTGANAALLAIQQNYVKKVIDTVNGYDNVLYEIANEAPAASKAWQYSLIDYIHAYEATKPKQHPVGMTSFDGPSGEAANVDLYGSTADWVSPYGGVTYRDNMPAAPSGKVTVLDTDHVWGFDPPGDDSAWFWKAFLRGHNPILMDTYGAAALSAYHTDPREYTAMGQTSIYSQKIHLLNATPQGTLSSTGYALTDAQEYLVYQPGSGAFTVNLTGGSGPFSVEWFDPATGTTTAGNPVTGGTVTTFTPPWNGSAVLLLVKQ
jgi:hypothetical protein